MTELDDDKDFAAIKKSVADIIRRLAFATCIKISKPEERMQ